MKWLITTFLAGVVFCSIALGQGVAPTLSAGLNGLIFEQGQIDVQLLSEIISSKQDELKQEAIKRYIFDKLPANCYTINIFSRNVSDVLLTEKNSKVIQKEVLENLSNFALVYGFSEFYLQTQLRDEHSNLYRLLAGSCTDCDKIGIKCLKAYYTFKKKPDGTSSEDFFKSLSKDEKFALRFLIMDMTFDACRNSDVVKDRGFFNFPLDPDIGEYESHNAYKLFQKKAQKDQAVIAGQIYDDICKKVKFSFKSFNLINDLKLLEGNKIKTIEELAMEYLQKTDVADTIKMISEKFGTLDYRIKTIVTKKSGMPDYDPAIIDNAKKEAKAIVSKIRKIKNARESDIVDDTYSFNIDALMNLRQYVLSVVRTKNRINTQLKKTDPLFDEISKLIKSAGYDKISNIDEYLDEIREMYDKIYKTKIDNYIFSSFSDNIIITLKSASNLGLLHNLVNKPGIDVSKINSNKEIDLDMIEYYLDTIQKVDFAKAHQEIADEIDKIDNNLLDRLYSRVSGFEAELFRLQKDYFDYKNSTIDGDYIEAKIDQVVTNIQYLLSNELDLHIDNDENNRLPESQRKILGDLYAFTENIALEGGNIELSKVLYIRDSILPQLVILTTRLAEDRKEVVTRLTGNVKSLVYLQYYFRIKQDAVKSLLESYSVSENEISLAFQNFIALITRLNQLDKSITYQYIVDILEDIGFNSGGKDKETVALINDIFNNISKYVIIIPDENRLGIDVESFISYLYDKYADIKSGAMELYFSIGLNQGGFFNNNKFPLDDITSLSSLAFATEKVGIKWKFWDIKKCSFERSLNKPEDRTYNQNPFVKDVHLIGYGSGLLYSIVNTTTNSNFDYPMLGLAVGPSFFNDIDINAGVNWAIKGRHFIPMYYFGFDIKIAEYLSELGKKRKRLKAENSAQQKTASVE